MSTSYLNDTYLGAPADLGPVEVGSAGNLPSLAGDPNLPAAPSDDNVRLPGGIVIPKKTFAILVGALIVVAVIWYMKTRKKD
jgi:hypothetical protein